MASSSNSRNGMGLPPKEREHGVPMLTFSNNRRDTKMEILKEFEHARISPCRGLFRYFVRAARQALTGWLTRRVQGLKGLAPDSGATKWFVEFFYTNSCCYRSMYRHIDL
ncbi:MAG: hypothetical protein Q7K57_36970 [Burkholderiaceae bacterium]|nr:hypothetical protein [Burkholderiaceae bacterium]